MCFCTRLIVTKSQKIFKIGSLLSVLFWVNTTLAHLLSLNDSKVNVKWLNKQLKIRGKAASVQKEKKIFKRPSKNLENQSIPLKKINKLQDLEAKTKEMRDSSRLLHSTSCTRAFCKHLIRCWYCSSASEGTCCMTFQSAGYAPTDIMQLPHKRSRLHREVVWFPGVEWMEMNRLIFFGFYFCF